MSFLAFSLAALLAAQERPLVPGFDRLFEKDPAEAGRLLLGELNCVTCHKPEGAAAEHFSIKEAPVLTLAGDRVRPEWVRAYLADPQKVKPGTTMPKATLTPDDIEALTHFLATLKSSKPVEPPAGPAPKGKDLFNTLGCAACHDPLGREPLIGSVPLPDLRAKYASAAVLARFLMDPAHVRPSGRMPKMNLTAGEAMALATSFIGLPPRASDDPAETLPGLAWEAYEGAFGKLPDFDALKPSAGGTSERFDIGVSKKADNFALRWRGYLEAPADGLYTFSTNSDDGSMLRIGDTVIVNNDGVHGGQDVVGAISLKRGKHAFAVTYFEAGGGEELSVKWQGPGFAMQNIPAKALSRPVAGVPVARAAAGLAEAAFMPEAALVEKGRGLFVQKRCSSCHKAGDLKPLPFKPLAQVKREGCLIGAPNTGKFHLTEPMTKAIRAALDVFQTIAEKPTPAQKVDRALVTLNCLACHERGGKGGVTPERYPVFTTAYEDTGDEGRLPPHLNGVGAKLRKDWLNTVLGSGQKVRPYMHTRMPVFGAVATAGLADAFEAADAAAAAESKPRDPNLVKAGRQLAGTKGLSCVTCHTFQNHKSLGIPGMDLVHMGSRLRRDWFGKYLLDPPSLRPGTRMPTYWPDGKSVRKDILEGDTPRQIEALWQFLAEGSKAALPVGIGPQPILLQPATEAVMYRNFIQGAGARAIGVGFPEKAHYAFDANQLRLALIWQGDFIDASKHWVDRGAGFQGPAGEAVVQLPEGAPFAVLAEETAAWPKESGHKAGYQFVGYDLDAKLRPTLRYRWEDLEVTDLILAVDGKPAPHLTRTLSFKGTVKPGTLYRAAASKKIEAAGDGAWKLDGGLTIKLDRPARLRTVGGLMELLVPVSDAPLTQTYLW